ncbi:hypothetical protein QUA56_06555 [Microcoleus sp. N3A4]|uniref:hypothetical protein n=1 Tax=Microcoleus sp. N3A4 TaxID=3055379 RepID=UPI002FCE7908
MPVPQRMIFLWGGYPARPYDRPIKPCSQESQQLFTRDRPRAIVAKIWETIMIEQRFQLFNLSTGSGTHRPAFLPHQQ